MITACPKCAARYRIDPERLRPEGSRLRCSRCEAVFRVRPGGAAPSQPNEIPPEQVTPAPPSGTGADTASVAAPPDPTSPKVGAEGRREKLVLVADPGVESGKAVASALTDWGLEAILVHDGVEAILTIQRILPRAVVLDASLPKMFGSQVCELMKRNESLRTIQVVLVGASHDHERYRESAGDQYGADSYVERPQLPGALRSVFEGFGLPLAAAAVAQAPPASPTPPEIELAAAPAEAPRAPEPTLAPMSAARPPGDASAEVTIPEVDPAVNQAERLARIIVSDIVLYNPEKFDAATKQGNVVQAMDKEMEEGRALFAERVDATVRVSRDFLAEELERVARQRGGG